MDPYKSLTDFFEDASTFIKELTNYLIKTLHFQFLRFESKKSIFVGLLYRQRGRMAKRLIHSGMAGLTAVGVLIAPVIAQEFPGRTVNPWDLATASSVLGISTTDTQTALSSDRGNIVEYQVKEGDTVSSIAEKFGISSDTIRWQNNLPSKDSIKVGQTLQVLPITGIAHKVQKGDTLNSIAKKYDVDPQQIVNYPFNTYSNDETFDLAVGQTLIVPDGKKPDEIPWSPIARVRQLTPNAGTVTATGSFVWPTNGTITQRFVWYHPGVDIANPAGPNVLAADSGTITVAGWLDNSGYGNRIIIDHGNGTKTLYAHLSQVYVVVGQTVNRGSLIGKMGSTGRSTGTHLHFEVIRSSGRTDPLTALR